MSTFPARAVVNLDAIAGNVRALADYAPTAQVMAVVKADAYGHGLVPSAQAAIAGGARWLGVAQVPEAIALRAAVPASAARVLTWLYAPGAPLAAALEADVDLSVHAGWALAEVVAAARETGRVARVHLKVDTGLGRNGLTPTDLEALLPDALRAQSEGAVELVGVWSHFAFADEPDHPTVLAQAEVFDEVVGRVEAAGAHLEVRHLANSAATLTAPRMHYDLVRPGLAVYGLTPVPQLGPAADHGLTPAMTVEAELANVKRIAAGHGVSYGHRYRTTRDTVLGVVPLGYSDGVPRHASGDLPAQPGGPLLVGATADGGGRLLRVAGRVCMDQFVLDLGPDATEQAGDVVRLFGPGTGADTDGLPTAQDWAEAAGTISYEIVTRIGARVPRVYVGGEATAGPSAQGAAAAESESKEKQA
ncbi:alanine racemase [Paraoerskovia marina]|uniref:Alanine racemase n=1 Tax=Paraoerskovia marina TaxID=545619 RepID=A0A1H1V7G9_9CELL|nr:alanine racemase [Paraoerskovia marina]SDS80560.1 alanine racemase [Paraoerskovia marina]